MWADFVREQSCLNILYVVVDSMLQAEASHFFWRTMEVEVIGLIQPLVGSYVYYGISATRHIVRRYL
jgi:hypothetical protein